MAELTLSAADIASAIKKNLEGFTPSLEARTVGRVTSVGDGIANISGLPDCAVNELLEFEDGTRGLALNLEEESIGSVVLGESDRIEEGQTVKATGEILSVPVGEGVLGRVVNALGEPIDGKGPIQFTERRRVADDRELAVGSSVERATEIAHLGHDLLQWPGLILPTPGYPLHP